MSRIPDSLYQEYKKFYAKIGFTVLEDGKMVKNGTRLAKKKLFLQKLRKGNVGR